MCIHIYKRILKIHKFGVTFWDYKSEKIADFLRISIIFLRFLKTIKFSRWDFWAVYEADR